MVSPGEEQPNCEPGEHAVGFGAAPHESDIERAVRLFKALGDRGRFRLLLLLQQPEACVSELIATPDEPL